uniref:E3 ubiquitin-protein ligase NEURL1B n=1 Tax=Electrophorus electricus TaxID=8005 RepID=A0A4W4F0R3_ELEEL
MPVPASPPLSSSPESPRFHPHAKGKNIRLDAQLRRATRKNSFCNGITFSQQPVCLYEKVHLRLSGVHTGWSGALRFGFTSLDPGELAMADIPKYACPDLVTRQGYWAKALPERLAACDNVLAFWADRHGRVFYTVNEGEPVLFHCGLSIGCPLWAIIDIYGITQEVTLLGEFVQLLKRPKFLTSAAAKMASLQFSNYHQLSPCSSSSSTSSSIPSSSTSIISQRSTRGVPLTLDADMRFNTVHGADVVLSSDRTVACIHFLDSSRTLVFSDRPVRLGESLYVEVGHLGLPYFGALLFGMTSCDPGTLHTGELPADPDVLLDRKEYWVMYRGFPSPGPGDVLSFTMLDNGEVHHGVNGAAHGRLLCVDSSQVLWAFFTLHGAVNRLKILGNNSDLAFSVNRSSSASESSLGGLEHSLECDSYLCCSSVTAPSSPLSLPVSPSLSFPEVPISNKSSECTVCFDQEVDTVIYTCGHMCLCNDCGLKLKKQKNTCCPICRRPIKDVIKTYRP